MGRSSPSVQVIPPLAHAAWQRKPMPTGQVDRGIAHDDSVRSHERGDQTRKLGSKPLVFLNVPRPDVEMSESRRMGNLVPHHRQGFAAVTQDEELPWRDAIGMRSELKIEDVNVALRHELAQMIIRPAVAEAEFEHRPRELLDQLGRAIEASALRLQTTDEAIETAHWHRSFKVIAAPLFVDSRRLLPTAALPRELALVRAAARQYASPQWVELATGGRSSRGVVDWGGCTLLPSIRVTGGLSMT
jgi:hypothetical protein